MALLRKLWAALILLSYQISIVTADSKTNSLHPPATSALKARANSIPSLPKSTHTFHEEGTKLGQRENIESQNATTGALNASPLVTQDSSEDNEGSNQHIDRISDVGSSFQTQGTQKISLPEPQMLTVDAQSKTGLDSISDYNVPPQFPRGGEESVADTSRIDGPGQIDIDDDGDDADEEGNYVKDGNDKLQVVGDGGEGMGETGEQARGLDETLGTGEYGGKIDTSYTSPDLGGSLENTDTGNIEEINRALHDSISNGDSQSEMTKRRFDSIGNNRAFAQFGKKSSYLIDEKNALPSNDKRRFDSIGDSAFTSFGKRRFDSIGNSAFANFGKRRFDSIGNSAFANFGKRRFDSIGNSAFANFGKRRFDPIGNSAFSNFGKRRFDSIGDSAFTSFGKRRFDSIGNSAFANFGKRRFDSIGNSAFANFGKRRFDPIGDSAFSNFGKRRFDSIGNSAFANFGKRRFDSIGNSAFANFGKRRFDSIGNSAFSNFGKRRFDSIGNSAFSNFGKRDHLSNGLETNGDQEAHSNHLSALSRTRRDAEVIEDVSQDKNLEIKKRGVDLRNMFDDANVGLKKRVFDSIDGRSSFRRFGRSQDKDIFENNPSLASKRRFDSIGSKSNFGLFGKRGGIDVEDKGELMESLKKMLNTINSNNALHDNMSKRRFDRIGYSNFASFGKRRFDTISGASDFGNFGKRRFDTISGASDFGNFGKRRFDTISGASDFGNFGKRRFDSIHHKTAFTGFGKRRLDSIGGGQFSTFGKRFDSQNSEPKSPSTDVEIMGLLSLLSDLDPAELKSLGLILDGKDSQFLTPPPDDGSLSSSNVAKRRFDSIDSRSAFRRFGRYNGRPSTRFSLVPDFNSNYPISSTAEQNDDLVRLLSTLHRYVMSLKRANDKRAYT